jgi:hypothetical protein
MQRLALAPRGARWRALVGSLSQAGTWVPSRTSSRVSFRATSLALTVAALAPGCVIVERHYYPVPGPAPAGATDPSGAPLVAGAVAAPQASGEATVPPTEGAPVTQNPPAPYPVAVATQTGPPVYPGPSGDYDSQLPRFAFTIDGSLEVDDKESLYGFGLFVIPAESPVGFYMNTRFTAHSYGYPDFTDLFATNAFGHEVVDEELHAFVFNFGLVAPVVSDVVNLFAGIGFAATETELELRDPAGVFGDNGQYYQRIDEDEDFNFNVGALILLDALALNAQWDTALEVFSFGVGFAF